MNVILSLYELGQLPLSVIWASIEMIDSRYPLVILDQSYALIFRYYALKAWYRKAHPQEERDQAWSKNAVYMEKYATRYVESIEKIVKSVKTPMSNVVIAVDDNRKNLFRTRVDPTYKADRVYDVELNRVLSIAHDTVVPEVVRRYDMKMISQRALEADDVAACVAAYAASTGKFDSRIVILSFDKDLTQIHSSKISQLTLTGKPVVAKQTLLEHIILGDASDNVSSCLPFGMGPKALQKLLEDDCAGLKQLLKKDAEFARCFEINQRLIDFNFIPASSRLAVIRKFQRLVN